MSFSPQGVKRMKLEQTRGKSNAAFGILFVCCCDPQGSKYCNPSFHAVDNVLISHSKPKAGAPETGVESVKNIRLRAREEFVHQMDTLQRGFGGGPMENWSVRHGANIVLS